MRIGYKSRMLDDPGLEIRQAARQGFRHVEFALRTVEVEADCFSPQWMSRVRNEARDLGISLSVHAKGGIPLSCSIPRVQRLYLEIYDTMLTFCHGIEARWLTVHVGKVGEPWSPGLANSRLKIAAASLAELAPRALAAGVPLALENLFDLGPLALSFYLGTTPDQLEPLVRAHPPAAVGFLLDVGHAALGGGSGPWVDRLGDRLLGVHLHANDLESDLHAGLDPALSASWHPAVRALCCRGVTCPLVLEVDPQDRLPSLVALNEVCSPRACRS